MGKGGGCYQGFFFFDDELGVGEWRPDCGGHDEGGDGEMLGEMDLLLR